MTSDGASRRVLDDVQQGRSAFDDAHACFLDASLDPEDEQAGRFRDDLPGIRFFWNVDRQACRFQGDVAKPAVLEEAGAEAVTWETASDEIVSDAMMLGKAVSEEEAARQEEEPRRFPVVLDARLLALAVTPFGDDPGRHVARILAVTKNLAERVPPTCRGSRNA